MANSFHTIPQQALAAALIERFGPPNAKVFFANTGTEATEAAIKLALRATGKRVIVAFERAFHGRSIGGLSLTANPAYRDPYIRCLGEEGPERFAEISVIRAPFNDLAALEKIFAEQGSEIAAVFLEPIQGEAGIFPASREFLLGVHALCQQHGALVGADEIQTGTGRTGKWSAWQAIVGDEGPRPDILWLAKALGGGFPVAACIASNALAEHMTRGSHGTTFGGNPVACAAALATIDIIEKEGLLEKAGAQLSLLQEIAKKDPLDAVTEIRGMGAMLGIQIGQREDKAAADPWKGIDGRRSACNHSWGSYGSLAFPLSRRRKRTSTILEGSWTGPENKGLTS